MRARSDTLIPVETACTRTVWRGSPRGRNFHYASRRLTATRTCSDTVNASLKENKTLNDTVCRFIGAQPRFYMNSALPRTRKTLLYTPITYTCYRCFLIALLHLPRISRVNDVRTM